MENNPEAAGAAQAPQTEATPNTNTNEPAKAPETPAAPDMHGFTSEQLAEMRKFYDANGGFDKVKSRLSNPEPKAPEQPKTVDLEPRQASPFPEAKPPVYQAPEGSITAEEFLAKQYFGALANEEKYSAISKEIASGELLKEMKEFNISPLNQDGSINDQMVRRYLDLKAQTVQARQPASMPEASAAPTVDYVPVGETIKDAQQARDIIMQDTQLRMRGAAGHPRAADAEKFLKDLLSPAKK